MDRRPLLLFILLIHDGYFVSSYRVHSRRNDDLTLLEEVRHRKKPLVDIVRDYSGLSRRSASERKSCGIRLVKTGDRLMKILGGSVSEKGFWPWQVAIFDSNAKHICGGTLIAPRWVLTAAHCTHNEYGLTVALGEHHLERNEGKEIKMEVEEYINYDGYNVAPLRHDIALLRLPRNVTYNDYILPACLPSPMAELPKQIRCTVSGWGKEKGSHTSGSTVLMYVEVPIVSMADCKHAYPNHPPPPNSFCAGSMKQRIDTCEGDSGGPLVCSINGSWFVYGVTSYGDGCNEKKNFGVYTEVSSYMRWIRDTMSQYDL